MQKSNEYFDQFGITTITFSDDNLVDMDACFEVMKTYLAKRPDERIELDSEIEELDNL